MAIKRMVEIEFWRSPANAVLSPEAKLVLLYLMTGPRSTLDGLMTFSQDDCVRETGLSDGAVTKALAELQRVQPHDGEPSIWYDKSTRVLWITKRLEHEFESGIMSDRQREAVRRNITATYPCPIVLAFCDRYMSWGEPFVGCREIIGKRVQGVTAPPVETKAPTPKVDTVASGEAHILGVLSTLTGRTWQPGLSYGVDLRARLTDGKYTPEDIEKVVRFKVKEWLHNDKMAKYLRPITLFRKSHFETYLQEARHDAQGHRRAPVQRDARGNVSAASAAQYLFRTARQIRAGSGGAGDAGEVLDVQPEGGAPGECGAVGQRALPLPSPGGASGPGNGHG